mmetsp:Transcript_25108/g.58030  ORF Transcript_25108/g.58030 Transcript_25108/m.58030 type:complete len:320 (-) Transcript_25108:1142-2101(-)
MLERGSPGGIRSTFGTHLNPGRSCDGEGHGDVMILVRRGGIPAENGTCETQRAGLRPSQRPDEGGGVSHSRARLEEGGSAEEVEPTVREGTESGGLRVGGEVVRGGGAQGRRDRCIARGVGIGEGILAGAVRGASGGGPVGRRDDDVRPAFTREHAHDAGTRTWFGLDVLLVFIGLRQAPFHFHVAGCRAPHVQVIDSQPFWRDHRHVPDPPSRKRAEVGGTAQRQDLVRAAARQGRGTGRMRRAIVVQVRLRQGGDRLAGDVWHSDEELGTFGTGVMVWGLESHDGSSVIAPQGSVEVERLFPSLFSVVRGVVWWGSG